MKVQRRLSLSIVLAVMLLVMVSFTFWEKEENKLMAEEQKRELPGIDVENNVVFETATFSLG